MKSKACLSLFVMTALISSCQYKSQDSDSLKTIEVNISQAKTIPLESGKIIPLETNDSSMVYGISTLEIIEGKIIVHSRDLLKSFDLDTGEYISDLVIKGQGPGEITGIRQFWVEGDTLCIYDFNSKKILKKRTDGEIVSESHPFTRETKDDEFSCPIYLIRNTENTDYVALNSYTDGTTTKNPTASVYDKDFNFVCNIEGREMRDGAFLDDRMTPDKENRRMLMWEGLKDTLFSIKNNRITPIYAFDFGSEAFPPEYQNIDELFERLMKFKEKGAPKYASLVNCFQKLGDRIYFVFSTSDNQIYIGCLDTEKDTVSTYQITDPTGHFTPKAYLKIYKDNLVVPLTDNQNSDNNPALFFLPVSNIQ